MSRAGGPWRRFIVVPGAKRSTGTARPALARFDGEAAAWQCYLSEVILFSLVDDDDRSIASLLRIWNDVEASLA